jgi:hypothetical protein
MANANISLGEDNLKDVHEYDEDIPAQIIQYIEDMRVKAGKTLKEIESYLRDLSQKYENERDPEVKRGIARMFKFYKGQLKEKKGLFNYYDEEQRGLGIFPVKEGGKRKKTRRNKKSRRHSRRR